MLNLVSNKYWPIGLDIGTDSIKMLQLRGSGASVAVTACSLRRIDDADRDDPNHRREVVIKAIRHMLRHGGFKGSRVVSALSCSQLGIKNIRLPHMTGSTLQNTITHEAQERFGFEVEPDRLKYLLAGQVRTGNEVYDEIIMLAVHSEIITEHMAMLDEMGLRCEHIELAPLALFRVFQRSLRRRADEDTVTVVLDIGFSATRIVVARGKQVVFLKSIDIGGRTLTEAVASQLNLSSTEARQIRLQSSKSNGDDGKESSNVDMSSVDLTVHDAVRGQVEALAREVSLCLRYCSVTFRGLRPQQIMLTGGESYDQPLVNLLGEHLGVECVVGYPLRGINVSAVDLGGDRRGVLAEWALCTGLASRDINFAGKSQEVGHARRRLSA